jgi:hypothetical protein
MPSASGRRVSEARKPNRPRTISRESPRPSRLLSVHKPLNREGENQHDHDGQDQGGRHEDQASFLPIPTHDWQAYSWASPAA